MKNYVLIILAIFLFSCEDIIEEDISKKGVNVLSPPDQFNPETSTVNFFWDYLEGADDYQIEVVRGRFDSVTSFVVDTFVQINQFTFNFNPGEYEWSLRALNSVSSTAYIVRSFRIDSSSNLAFSSVNLVFPAKEVYRDSSLTLRWDKVFSATSYEAQIVNSANGNIVFQDTTSTNSVSTGDILSSNDYEWRVKALNAQSETDFASSTFSIDLLAPGAPSLQSPADGLTPAIGPEITFTWQKGRDANDNWEYDRLYIYEGSLSATPRQYDVMTESFTDTAFNAGSTYFWRVKSFDVVDNESEFSTNRSFTAQ